MEPATVGRIIERAAQHWTFSNDIEITLEANPGSVERDRFAGYRSVGVNRVSLGIQALDDADLRRLGRLHSVEDALSALDVARGCFERVSFDLIYARQDQSLNSWQSELTRALSFEPDHLSLYQLTIEDGTAFGERFRRGRLKGLPDEDLGADMYEATQVLAEAAGLPAYEISNHARAGCESRHNLIYWSSGDWIGIGPGAHGRLTLGGKRIATETPLSPTAWLNAVGRENGESSRATLSAQDTAAEYLMMGLRLRDGVPIDNIRGHSTINWNKIKYLDEIGILIDTNGTLKLTDAGRPVLNAVLRELIVT